MSLITRCPACATMFRVVPDQLRISDGWVRCGHCAEVFDASANLQTQVVAVPPPPAEPPPAAPVAAAAVPAATSTATSTAESSTLSPDAFTASASAFMPPAATQVEEPPADMQVPAFAAVDSDAARIEPLAGAFAAEPAPPPAFVQAEAWPEPTPEEMRNVIFAAMQRPSADTALPVAEAAAVLQAQAPQEQMDAQPAPLAQADAPDAAVVPPLTEAAPFPVPEDDAPRSLGAAATAATAEAALAGAVPVSMPAIEDLSFVRAARRKAMWSRPAVRWGLALLSLLLFLALALQITLQERDRIAAIDARARPWLEQLCVPMGCKVAPLKRIESIVIESSGFNKVRGNAYRLTLSLRNKGTVPLAMPGIELALTDGQDQPVLRRVLLPADLGAAQVLAPGAEWSAALPVSVALSGPSARIAGYRLLAFYP